MTESSRFEGLLAGFATVLKKHGAPALLPPKPKAKAIEKLRAYLRHYEIRELFEWLALCDGISLSAWIGGTVLGAVGNEKLGVTGIQDLISLYDEWPRKDLIPIAADGSGQFFCIVGSEWNEERDVFPVGYVDALALDRVEFYVAASMEAFLRALLTGVRAKEFEWHFNRKRLLSSDPHLAHVQRSLLPWDQSR